MTMTYTLILIILGIVLITFLFKTATKLAIALTAIFFLFGVGFIWGPSDLNEKLGLSTFLKPEYSMKVNNFLTSFEQKREENSVVDQTKLTESYNQAQQTVKTEAEGWFTIAKDKFLTWLGFAKEQSAQELTELQTQIQQQIQTEIQKQVEQQVQNAVQGSTGTPSTTPTDTTTQP